jgi:tetratricopeptide (TPR) repeat protein
MCYLRQNAFAQARGWLGKVVSVAHSSFWRDQAKPALLEADLNQGNLDAFFADARNQASKAPSIVPGLRVIMGHARAGFLDAGFYDRALLVQRFWVQMEKEKSMARLLSETDLPDFLQYLNLFKEAQSFALSLVDRPDLPAELQIQVLYHLSFIYSYQGKWRESKDSIERLRHSTSDAYVLSRCDIAESANLRGQERFDETVDLLLSLREKYPEIGERVAFACIQAARILSALGKTAEARKLTAETIAGFPNDYLPEGGRSDELAIPCIVDGDYARAAELYLKDLQTFEDSGIALHAGQGVKAGITLELAGREAEAREAWAQTEKRFPAFRCCFLGTLAQNLAARSADKLEDMPYAVQNRVEMFFLVGLLHEKRGNTERGRKLFQRAAQEDPTNLWPTVLAKKKL